MSDNAWAGVLMVTLAVLIAVGFFTVWVRDRGRSREQASDSERGDTETRLGATSREGAVDRPHDTREGRH
jgi:hypothetical protein